MKTVFFSAALTLSVVTICFSATCDPIAQELAKQLVLQERYREAEVEYERALIGCQDPRARTTLIGHVIDTALRTNDASLTLRIIRSWDSRSPSTERCVWRVGEGKTLLRLNNPEAVLKLSTEGCDEPSRRALIYGQGLACFSQLNWTCAQEKFAGYPRAIAAVEKGQNWEPLSPAVAATWSALIPGAGYAYARKPQTAVAAFVTNGLFISATYFASRTRAPALAILPGMFSASWYFGAVRGSAQAAQNANERKIRELMAPIRSFSELEERQP